MTNELVPIDLRNAGVRPSGLPALSAAERLEREINQAAKLSNELQFSYNVEPCVARGRELVKSAGFRALLAEADRALAPATSAEIGRHLAAIAGLFSELTPGQP
jgi:hypothetical protein